MKELSPAFQGWVSVEYNSESRRDDRECLNNIVSAAPTALLISYRRFPSDESLG